MERTIPVPVRFGRCPLHSKLTFRGVPTGRDGMTIRTILPTKDPLSGFWAASERNGYEVRLVWAMASDALARIFALTPAEVRDFLDSPAGRLLADELCRRRPDKRRGDRGPHQVAAGPSGLAAVIRAGNLGNPSPETRSKGSSLEPFEPLQQTDATCPRQERLMAGNSRALPNSSCFVEARLPLYGSLILSVPED